MKAFLITSLIVGVVLIIRYILRRHRENEIFDNTKVKVVVEDTDKERWTSPPDLSASDTIKPEMGEKSAPIRTPFVDVCQCSERKRPKRKRAWRITHYRHNHSAFHGGYQSSAYSGIMCLVCGHHWRTRANYVESLQHITSFEWEMILKAKRFPAGYIEFDVSKLMLRGEYSERDAGALMTDIVIVAGESWPADFVYNNASNGGVLETTLTDGITPDVFNAIFSEEGTPHGEAPEIAVAHITMDQTGATESTQGADPDAGKGEVLTEEDPDNQKKPRGDMYKKVKKYLAPLVEGNKITASEVAAAFNGMTRDEAASILNRLLMNMYLSASSSPDQETVYTITKRMGA